MSDSTVTPATAAVGSSSPAGKSAEKKRSKKQHSWWFRWRFHLSGLLILIPVVLTPFYLEQMSLFRGDQGLGAHIVGTQQIGPWQVTLAEEFELPPRLNGPAGYMKPFNLSLCDTCADQVKAVYLRIGKPRSLRTAGALGFGTPYRLQISIPVPENTKPSADLWLTLEGWDGSVHKGTWPLAEASPATIEFLKKVQGP